VKPSSKKILVTCLGTPISSPRPKKMADYLSIGNEVLLLSDYSKEGDPKFIHLDNSDLRSNKKNIYRIIRLFLLFLRRVLIFGYLKDFINGYLYGYKRMANDERFNSLDMIICHDLSLLPLAIALKERSEKNVEVIFDAREYYPKQYENDFSFNFLHAKDRNRLCRKLLKKCDKVLTVSDGIAEKYHQVFGVHPIVMVSAPYFKDHPVTKNEDTFIKAVYHGVANKNRNLEKIIKIFDNSDQNFKFDLYLTGEDRYIQNLKGMIETERVSIKRPVQFNQINSTIQKYDLGVIFYDSNDFNVKHCLPNKFFEYLQARLAIYTGPSIEMTRIIDEFGCGVYSKDFSSSEALNVLNSIDKYKLSKFKEGSNEAAQKYNFENEIAKVF
jgi:hypothetical protein